MSIVLTIDVGLLNLGLCCATRDDSQINRIIFWELLNIIDTDIETICICLTKAGKICNKNASFINVEKKEYYCKIHCPKEKIKILPKRKRVQDYSLQDIASKLLVGLDDLIVKNNFDNITHVLIELQPKVNNKMKFASHIIYGRLVQHFLGTNTTIRFIAAKNKLKFFQGPALPVVSNTYANRKKNSIKMVDWYLQNKIADSSQWSIFLSNCKKKDDVCDTLLYAINFLSNEKIVKKSKKN